MQDTQHTVVAMFKAKSGKEQALKRTLQNLVIETVKEEGCIYYILHQSENDAAQFMLYEQWSTHEMFRQHGASEHIAEWRKIKNELIDDSQVTGWVLVKNEIATTNPTAEIAASIKQEIDKA